MVTAHLAQTCRTIDLHVSAKLQRSRPAPFRALRKSDRQAYEVFDVAVYKQRTSWILDAAFVSPLQEYTDGYNTSCLCLWSFLLHQCLSLFDDVKRRHTKRTAVAHTTARNRGSAKNFSLAFASGY